MGLYARRSPGGGLDHLLVKGADLAATRMKAESDRLAGIILMPPL